MKKVILAFVLFICITSTASAAYNPYGEIYTYEAYYNGQILEMEPAKPVLKIGEPFTVKVEMTLNQPSMLFVMIGSMRKGNPYEVIEGPSEFEETKHFEYLDAGTYTFEWTLKTTEEWAGGTMPVNFWYQINNAGEDEPIVNSEFTAVLPYISTEYYEAPEPTPTDHPETDTNQTPAFTLPAALLAIALVALRKRC